MQGESCDEEPAADQPAAPERRIDEQRNSSGLISPLWPKYLFILLNSVAVICVLDQTVSYIEVFCVCLRPSSVHRIWTLD